MLKESFFGRRGYGPVEEGIDDEVLLRDMQEKDAPQCAERVDPIGAPREGIPDGGSELS
jgi:hypothetical protein